MKNSYLYVLTPLLIAGLAAAACGGSNPEPDDDDDGTFVPIGGAGPGTGGAPGSGGAAVGTGGAVFVPPTRPVCPSSANGTQPAGPIAGEPCWDLTGCNAETEEQFLQQCNSGTCFQFNNATRIEGFTGALPPL